MGVEVERVHGRVVLVGVVKCVQCVCLSKIAVVIVLSGLSLLERSMHAAELVDSRRALTEELATTDVELATSMHASTAAVVGKEEDGGECC